MERYQEERSGMGGAVMTARNTYPEKPPADRPESPTEAALRFLAEQVHRLGNVAESLESRMGPVLNTSVPSPRGAGNDVEKSPVSCGSTLASGMVALAQQIALVTQQLTSIRDRCEL